VFRQDVFPGQVKEPRETITEFPSALVWVSGVVEAKLNALSSRTVPMLRILWSIETENEWVL